MKSPFPFAPMLAMRCLVVLLTACSTSPPVPDWQMNAKDALDRSLAAYLRGNPQIEMQEFEQARREIARTGRFDLLARAELTRCAGRVASLVLDECSAFEQMRQDAAAPERAYADFLAGRLRPEDAGLLPARYRAVAASTSDAAAGAALRDIADPLSRLIAAGVVFRAGRATPVMLEDAVETASAQGWRRPLLAWLGVQAMRAEQAGAREEAARLRRRIDFVQGSGTASPP